MKRGIILVVILIAYIMCENNAVSAELNGNGKNNQKLKTSIINGTVTEVSMGIASGEITVKNRYGRKTSFLINTETYKVIGAVNADVGDSVSIIYKPIVFEDLKGKVVTIKVLKTKPYS